MAKRKIVKIDEEKCDGCGLCIPSCSEGAIRIIDGKARIVSDMYCDGLGACLGTCPRDAITIEERDADEFDPEAVKRHLAQEKAKAQPKETSQPLACGCPGTMARKIDVTAEDDGCVDSDCSCSYSSQMKPFLANWPTQLHLIPPIAPYLDQAKLLICADCVPFAFADFHKRFVKGRIVINACPKLDDAQAYVEKLSSIFKIHSIKSIDLPRMEVPCCGGLLRIVQEAMRMAGVSIPVTVTTIGVNGSVMAEETYQ